MFVVTEDDAAAIRATFEREGELSAAMELRRRFPLIPDNATARQHVRMIAGWQPLPVTPGPAAPQGTRELRESLAAVCSTWADSGLGERALPALRGRCGHRPYSGALARTG